MIDEPAALRHVAELVNARLALLFEREHSRWNEVDPRLAEAISELERMATGGKRLRAAFCYAAWQGVRSEGQTPSDIDSAINSAIDSDIDRQIVDCACAFELLQTFALIHDDIMDAASTRRGETTIHIGQADRVMRARWRGEPRRYGEGVAILVGDLSHVYADRFVGSIPPTARAVWDELRIELNLGQYLDLRSAAAAQLDRETAGRVATFKSALYTIVRPLQLGALVADPDAPRELLTELDRFGRPVGQAFQLRDDLLGVFGDPETVGKPVGTDLREGKPTELLAVALEQADREQRATLDQVGRSDLNDAEIAVIVGVLVETGAVDVIEARIDSLIKHASEVAADLPFDEAAGTTLVALAEFVAARTY